MGSMSDYLPMSENSSAAKDYRFATANESAH